MDLDRAGIPGVFLLETLRLSTGAQSVCPLRAGPALSVSRQASPPGCQSKPARAPLGLLDQPGDSGNGLRVELVVRHQGLFAASVDSSDGGGRGWLLVVLCAASI